MYYALSGSSIIYFFFLVIGGFFLFSLFSVLFSGFFLLSFASSMIYGVVGEVAGVGGGGEKPVFFFLKTLFPPWITISHLFTFFIILRADQF